MVLTTKDIGILSSFTQNTRTPLIKTESTHFRLGSLHDDRERLLSYPPFQRKKVWGRRMKQVLIDSLLREFPVNALTLMKDTTPEGKRLHQVIDGQQRLGSAFDYIENMFPTMSEQEAKGRLLTLEPLYPGCKFRDLPLEVQNQLLDYMFPVIIFSKEQEDILEEVFMRFQNQEPLTIGERLFIRNGRARHVALALLEHPFWSTYRGANNRRETFQSALQMMTMEICDIPVHLKVSNENRSDLVRLILGEHDDELTATFQNTVWQRLSTITHAFQGIFPSTNVDLIILYQTAMKCEQFRFDLAESPASILNEWYHQAKRSLKNEEVLHSANGTRLTYIVSQQNFWQRHTETLQHVPGLVKK